jgi:hypothetical protein
MVTTEIYDFSYKMKSSEDNEEYTVTTTCYTVSLIKNGTKWVYSPGFDYTISGLYAAKKLANIVEKKIKYNKMDIFVSCLYRNEMTKKFDRDFQILLNQAENSLMGQSRGELRYSHLFIYVRIGKRLIDKNYVSCVHLVRLSIYLEQHQRKKLFTKMLMRIMDFTEKPIYVENILNKDFGDALLRRGFILIREDPLGLSRDMVLMRNSNSWVVGQFET